MYKYWVFNRRRDCIVCNGDNSLSFNRVFFGIGVCNVSQSISVCLCGLNDDEDEDDDGGNLTSYLISVSSYS